jgi:biotin carboxyl carrier protein
MPERQPAKGIPTTKEDHLAIARLADDLLPALIAKLASSGLGEIEVRQGGWKARLRKPATVAVAEPRKVIADSHSRAITTGHGRPDERDRHAQKEAEPGKVAATSPAVGVYNPRRDLVVGMRVRSGEKLGTVDVLGVQQDVLAPVEGIVGSSLAEAGEAVEYGQELVRIELPEKDPASGAPAQAVATAGKA